MELSLSGSPDQVCLKELDLHRRIKDLLKSVLIYVYRYVSVFRRTSPIESLLLRAIDLKRGIISQEAFRASLDSYYSSVDPSDLKEHINYESIKTNISKASFYKTDVLLMRGCFGNIFLTKKLLPLLRHWQIRIDLLEMQEGQEIPAHMHHGVVSGFMTLEGCVRIQHYDQIDCNELDTLVEKTIDRELSSGDYTTNSEYKDNIHWLTGKDDSSFLFRVTVTHIPNKRFADGQAMLDPRCYVNVGNSMKVGERCRLELVSSPSGGESPLPII